MSATLQVFTDVETPYSEINKIAQSTASIRSASNLQRLTETYKPPENKKTYRDLFFEIQNATTSKLKSQVFATSMTTEGGLILPVLTNSLAVEITETADNFIVRQKNAIKYKKEIILVAERISEFLDRKGVKAEICVDLFKDPEYTNWVEPKVSINVGKGQVAQTYNLFNELLAYSFSGISQKTLKRLSVTIDSR